MVQTLSTKFLTKFLEKHALSQEVKKTIKTWYAPIAEQIALHQNRTKQPLVIGINGCQGSGKSTLTDFLNQYLRMYFGLNVVSISLDDYYLSASEREELATNIHPLLGTRGVPGTHKIDQLDHDLAALTRKTLKRPLFIRRFNKATDNPFPSDKWTKVTSAPDVIILEGWCVGLNAEPQDALEAPINALEANEDPNGTWREYVNNQLKGAYQNVFERVDRWIMLKAPSFDVVAQWRKEQEAKLRLQQDKLPANKIMSEQEIERFVLFFERLTRVGLVDFSQTTDITLHLNETRKIVEVTGRFKQLCFPEKLAVFTDLDGTLLDHYSYEFQPAKVSVFLCYELGFPIIPCTSKTFKEIIAIRTQLGLGTPFIVENGAAVFLPKKWLKEYLIDPVGLIEFGEFYIKEFGQPRSFWLNQLKQYANDFAHLYKGFAQMTNSELAELTGLSEKDAEKAKLRHYSEPLHWLGDACQKKAFIQRMRENGATIIEGGRFLHVCGDESKGVALNWLFNLIKHELPGDWLSVALGDSENDSAMLEQADIAVQIKAMTHPFITLERSKGVMRSTMPGPTGWHEVMMQLISELDNHHIERIKSIPNHPLKEKHYG
ncbi:HAD-IIB family hydrolase [Pseudoalteromonas spongiae]|uniref:HAD-IIB family hydrolase n=1 Tax=Pseudoalteromonas spongiae TaxID=298657 RepID=UPI00373632A7